MHDRLEHPLPPGSLSRVLAALRFAGARGFVAAGVLAVLAFSAPVLFAWSVRLSHESDALRAERDRLVARAHDVEQKLAVARTELTRAEKVNEQLGATLQKQVERLAHVPSLLPAEGPVGTGYGWRRDPFTRLQQFHRGVDLCAPNGAPVIAPADGVVRAAVVDAGYGRLLTLDHGNGLVTRYGHLSAFKVRAGQAVRRGDVIALVGNTGRSTGAHVHYEVQVDGAPVDPMAYLPADGTTLTAAAR